MPKASAPRYVFPVVAVGSEPLRRGNGNGASDEPAEHTATWRLPADAANVAGATTVHEPSDEAPHTPEPTEAITELGEPTILVSRVTLREPPDSRVVLLRDPSAERAGAFRLLRHRLLKRGDPRVVAVTSPRQGEGKTTTAVNLALAMAEESQARVLLLDANLVRPAFGQILSLESIEGLLTGAELRIYPVFAVEGTRLHFAATTGPDAPTTSLDRVLFGSALVDLRTAYDYIVVDTCSVLEGADVNVLADLVDGLILTERAGVSRKRDLGRALDRLGSAPVLGAVLLDT